MSSFVEQGPSDNILELMNDSHGKLLLLCLYYVMTMLFPAKRYSDYCRIIHFAVPLFNICLRQFACSCCINAGKILNRVRGLRQQN